MVRSFFCCGVPASGGIRIAEGTSAPATGPEERKRAVDAGVQVGAPGASTASNYVDSQDTLVAAVSAAISELLDLGPSASWLAHIAECLEVVEAHVGASRLALIGPDGLTSWVISDGAANGGGSWGRACALPHTADTIAVIRGYGHLGVSCCGGPPDPSSIVTRPTTAALQLAQRDVLALPVRMRGQTVAALLLSLRDGGDRPPHPTAAEVAATTAGCTNSITSSRRHRSLLSGSSHSSSAVSNSGLAAATAGDGGGGNAMRSLSPAELQELMRLAGVLCRSVFGSDPTHVRHLSLMAGHLGALALAPSLSLLVRGLLDAMQDLLASRTALRLQPVLALLTHPPVAPTAAGCASRAAAAAVPNVPAVLFTQRGGAAAAVPGECLLETHTSVQSVAALAAAQTAGPPGGGGGGGLSLLLTSQVDSGSMVGLLGGGAESNAAASRLGASEDPAQIAPEGVAGEASCVRAVRVALSHTLLAEALKVLLEDKAGPGATLAGASAAHDAAGPATPHACTAPSAARRGNQQAPPTTQPAADNGSGIPPPAAFHVLAAAAAKEGADSTNNSVDWPGGSVHAREGSGALIVPDSLLPPLPPAPGGGPAAAAGGRTFSSPHLQPANRFHCIVLRHASAHLLDERQPCRDILNIGKLTGGAAGSLVLCVERVEAAEAAAVTAVSGAMAQAFSLSCNNTGGRGSTGPAALGGSGHYSRLRGDPSFRAATAAAAGAADGKAGSGLASAHVTSSPGRSMRDLKSSVLGSGGAGGAAGAAGTAGAAMAAAGAAVPAAAAGSGHTAGVLPHGSRLLGFGGTNVGSGTAELLLGHPASSNAAGHVLMTPAMDQLLDQHHPASLLGLHGLPSFALYLVTPDTLPSSALQAVVGEVRLLFGLLLDAFRSAIVDGGRVAAEMRGLQQQLLGSAAMQPPLPIPLRYSLSQLQQSAGGALHQQAKQSLPAAAGGTEGLGSAAARAAVALGSKTPFLGTHFAASAALRSLSWRITGKPAGYTSTLGRLAPGGQQAGMRLRESDTPAALLATGLDQQLSAVMNAAAEEDVGAGSIMVSSLAAGGDPAHWMLASTPEFSLQERAPGPSPMELMVDTMRTHLSAVASEAQVASEARAVTAQDMAALDLEEVIGRGGQGVVFRGYLHGLETAVKVMVFRDGEPLGEDIADDVTTAAAAADGAKAQADGKLEETHADARVRRAKRGAMEHAVMPTLSHPNILQVYAAFSNVVIVRCTYKGDVHQLRLCAPDDGLLSGLPGQGPLNQVLCFEYCDAGTLLSAAYGGAFRRTRNGPLPAHTSALAAVVRPLLVPLYTSLLEVALALRYMHSRRLVHCDIKPANLLIKGNSRDPRGWACKLSDFGCARLMTEMAAPPVSAGPAMAAAGSSAARSVGFRVAVPLGTLQFMSPECFIKDKLLTAAVDIYAFGITMWELLMCQMPYKGLQEQDVPRLVLRSGLRPEFNPLAPRDYCHLAYRCWHAQPSKRPTAVDLVHELQALLEAARAAADADAARQEQQQLLQAQQAAQHRAQLVQQQQQQKQAAAASAAAAVAARPSSSVRPLSSPHAETGVVGAGARLLASMNAAPLPQVMLSQLPHHAGSLPALRQQQAAGWAATQQ
ncbi:hypothetical protein CHLRE_02g141966v5 [Chlamydomonas reinhardtii]|uniref:Protein kinase domain-containing protein n=1 Tax=Chlamydomonas reinhardtii TaxID=3055 RepID=A0A2K3E4B5_CHLRE|nr:uncharacterized protein CHLRE_02g141966v5 [Chlamydomonas reinhardtii]PNW87635.1 hypothetical protein CHLRE_02g141966v5 [Chlamydomonas reinhardtii]